MKTPIDDVIAILALLINVDMKKAKQVKQNVNTHIIKNKQSGSAFVINLKPKIAPRQIVKHYKNKVIIIF